MPAYTETYNLPDHPKGDTLLPISFEVLVDAVALDLTDASVLLKAVGGIGYTYILTTDDDGGITITDATAGKFLIDKQVINWMPGTYRYYIEITLDSGEKYTFVEGTFKITPKI